MNKKEGGRGGQPRRGAPIGGVQLGFPILVGVPSFSKRGEREGVGEGEGKRGGAAPSLVQFGLAMGGDVYYTTFFL